MDMFFSLFAAATYAFFRSASCNPLTPKNDQRLISPYNITP